MGNSICASKVSHISRVASATVTDLVLFHLIGGDTCISSLDLLLFLCGARISIFVADVEGISSVSTFSCSSSIRVPPHSGEDSMVNTSMFSSIIIALTSLVQLSHHLMLLQFQPLLSELPCYLISLQGFLVHFPPIVLLGLLTDPAIQSHFPPN